MNHALLVTLLTIGLSVVSVRGGGGWDPWGHVEYAKPVKIIVKHVAKHIPVPKPYPVYKKVPIPRAVPVFKPLPVAKFVPKHVIVPVVKRVYAPYPVLKPFPVAKPFPVPKPYPVPVPVKVCPISSSNIIRESNVREPLSYHF